MISYGAVLTFFLVSDDTHTMVGLIVKSIPKFKDDTRIKIFGHKIFGMRDVT